MLISDCLEPPISRDGVGRISCLCAALWLIQVVPDIFAFLQDLWRIKISGEGEKSIVLSVCVSIAV